MHDNNHTNDFENYLQQQVSEHRMYPSDRVWKNVRGKIQPHKKWPALSVFTILIISALVVGTLLNKPVPDSITPNFVYSLQSPNNIQSSKTNSEVNSKQAVVDNNYSVDELTSRTITAAVEKIKIDEAVSKQLYGVSAGLPFENNSLISAQNTTNNSSSALSQNVVQNNTKAESSISNTVVANNSFVTIKNIDNYLFDVTSRLKSILNTEPSRASSGGVAFFMSRRKEELQNDDFDFAGLSTYKNLLPSFDKLGKTSSRFDFRFYATPSISYRRLKEKEQNTDAKSSGASLESDYRVNPSKAINHTPALGYETGIGLGYKLNKKFSLTGGFQFNISRYKINAFLYKDETAAVTLDEGEYASTVNTVSSLRSVAGNTPLTIRNRYYQISMPLGAEYQILNKGKFNWGLGASVQPTYTFDKQPLIISSNYKNYTDGSPYVRNWNVNVNAETFLGYTTGSYRWQLGPQIRYQMLPSLVDRYPNKEYLFNYGLKIGVVKQLK